jgi:hypothetical protein
MTKEQFETLHRFLSDSNQTKSLLSAMKSTYPKSPDGLKELQDGSSNHWELIVMRLSRYCGIFR